MATTTNFGWTTPNDTDLVKDGAAAIRTLGNSIDTSFVDLKGGTTDQVLAKNSGTDLDFKWVTSAGDIEGVTAGTGISGGGTSGTVTITNSMATAIDAKGDLIGGTGADTFARLAVGANGTVLTADSVETTGLKWASVAATKNFSLLGTGTLTGAGAGTVTVSGISGMDQIFVLLNAASTNTANAEIRIRINTDTAGNYFNAYQSYYSPASYASGNLTAAAPNQSAVNIGAMSSNAASAVSGYFMLNGCNTAGLKPYHYAGGGNAGGGDQQTSFAGGGYWNNSATVTSISLFSNGNFDAGTFTVYGAA